MFLGIRQIQHTSVWATMLIIVIITFTFLNLVVVSGILIGIVDGAVNTMRKEAYGDIAIKPLPEENRVLQTEQILSILDTMEGVASYSPHYTGPSIIEANYKEQWDLNAEPDSIAVTITGVDPTREDETADLRSLVKEGEYFDPDDTGYILIGKYNVDRYADMSEDYETLKGVYPGDTVRILAGNKSKEFIVKGIVDSKADPVSFRVYLPEKEFRRLYDRVDHNANQILIRLNDHKTEDRMKERLMQTDIAQYGKIETFTEGIPRFILDVMKTFGILGMFIGVVGIIVASITVFIVISINILSRRRQIGILKAIGITEESIEYAYVFQAGVYAIVGSTIGILLTFFIIKPYFIAHPIDFPYSFVSLSIDTAGTIYRCGIIFIVTLIAGLIPAWIVARQDTLNSILGRN